MKKDIFTFGIIIFGYILIISSLMNMETLLTKWDWYLNEVYGFWPRWAAYLRYSFSWLLRILGLAAGIGILCRVDLFRKLALFIACFTILTVYWKHPYDAYYLHTQRVVKEAQPMFGMDIPFEKVVLPAWIINCLLDIGFSASVIWYFTRPRIVVLFTKKNNTNASAT